MGRLTTHVLDTARGRPAGGIPIALARREGERWLELARAVTNADGRTDRPLAEGDSLQAGEHQLTFAVASYLEGEGFLGDVPIRFRVDDPAGHYHVPLLLSPWAYSTYRGS